MTKEALKLALEVLVCLKKDFDADQFEWEIADEAITAIKEALAQPEQEPVAWGVFEGNLHDMFFTEAEAVEMAQLKGTHAEVRPLPFEFRQPGAQALLVTAEGEFIWHKDAESMIKNGDFSNSPSLRFILQRLWSQGATMNEFNPDWDAMAVMVEEQQRMAKRIEDLEAMLERQTARIVDLQTHIENFDGEDR